MANIVYGVSGEGSGHSSRAREMLAHLQSCGHTIKVASYDRGYRNLYQDFDTHRIVGLTIVSEDNQVSSLKTLIQNLAAVPSGQAALTELKESLFKRFQPDCVITDFEPMTAYLAQHYNIPLISLDNQHRMRYMEYPCPPGYRKDAILTEAIIRAIVPRPSVSLITTFFFGKLKNKRSFLFPPILRRAVLDLSANRQDHILVYVTAGYDSLIKVLKTFHRERFLVYGYDKNDIDGPLHYRPFSKEGFLCDLAAAKCVIATAGFTLITEALYLGKPYLALPMKGQFEQILNALMLEKLGYGKHVNRLDRGVVAAFFYGLPDYEAQLHDYSRQGNRAITDKLDELLADNCHLLKYYHVNRHSSLMNTSL